MVLAILACVTRGSTAPGVQAGSGRPPWLRHPEVFVGRAGAHALVLALVLVVGAAMAVGTDVRVLTVSDDGDIGTDVACGVAVHAHKATVNPVSANTFIYNP